MAEMMRIGQLVLGRYEVIDLLPEGGQAMLAKGEDRHNGPDVVIKQLSADPNAPDYAEQLARFERTAQVRIGHPVVVDPVDSGEEDGQHYIIMPHVDGLDLDVHVRTHGGKLPVDETVAIVRDVASGLHAIHAGNIVHRDIKPANILVVPSGGPRIIDLGICRNVREATITQGSGLLGTLEWMAPEQMNESTTVDRRADLYSLGAVLYFLLVGVPPFQSCDIRDLVACVLQQPPIPPRQHDPSIPPNVEKICLDLLAKRPEERLQDADQVCRALGASSCSALPTSCCPFCTNPLLALGNYCPVCGGNLQAGGAAEVLCLACGAVAGVGRTCPVCRQAFSDADHQLQFTTGAAAGKRYRIPEGDFVVGRDVLEPRDSHISRRHFRVCCLNGVVLVQDAGSTNGTYVAGLRADRETPLVPGQELRIAGNVAIYITH